MGKAISRAGALRLVPTIVIVARPVAQLQGPAPVDRERANGGLAAGATFPYDYFPRWDRRTGGDGIWTTVNRLPRGFRELEVDGDEANRDAGMIRLDRDRRPAALRAQQEADEEKERRLDDAPTSNT